MHNTGKINFNMHGKFYIFCIHSGNQWRCNDMVVKFPPQSMKAQSFTAFTLDSDDDLNMSPSPSCTPVTPFNVEQTTT
jgi:hypothetical protein